MNKCKTKAIQTNLGTFVHNHAYAKLCVTLANLEPWYIQNSDIFRTLVYLEAPYIQNAIIIFANYNYFRGISLSRSLLHEINIMR